MLEVHGFSRRARTLGLAWLACGGLFVSACGGDDESSNSAGGSSGGSFDPEYCPPMMERMLAPGCTQAEVDAYTTCLAEACEPTFVKCYGPDYRSGKFGGACKQPLECATEGCRCDDLACFAACPGADTCTACFVNDRCGLLECAQPKCALDAAFGDAGIDFGKTCDEVLACCATLDVPQREQCTASVDMIKAVTGASSDLACSPLFAAFGAGSTDPACK